MYEQAEITMRAAGVEPNKEIVKAHGLTTSDVSDNQNDVTDLLLIMAGIIDALCAGYERHSTAAF